MKKKTNQKLKKIVKTNKQLPFNVLPKKTTTTNHNISIFQNPHNYTLYILQI